MALEGHVTCVGSVLLRLTDRIIALTGEDINFITFGKFVTSYM